MMKKINFGIIGCGDVTEKKSGPAFQKLEGSMLYAVMRRNEEKLKDYAQRHGVAKYSTNYLDLLEDPEIDAIYIATPPEMHHFYTIEAAKHGKAVYVEKPMATTVAECEEMIATCKQYEVPLFVAYYRRAQDKFQKAKEIVDSNALGEIRSFNYKYTAPLPDLAPERSWILDKKVAGGGLLYDIGSHMIDILLFLFGDVKMASGLSTNQSQFAEVNDNTSGFIQFKNGVQGSLQLTFNAMNHQDELTIEGTKGTLVFSIMSNEPVILKTDSGTEKFEFEPIEHVQMPLIKRVVDTLLGKDDFVADGLYGLRTQEILETFENRKRIVYE